MKILLILGHPLAGSFNHAVAERAVTVLREAGHEVMFHDLYAEGFDPILPGEEIPRYVKLGDAVSVHCTELRECGGIIIVHPNWWGQPPAIIKGWVDRVIRPDVAYRFLEGDGGEGVPEGLLKGKRAMVFNTSNTPVHREQSEFGDPLEILWRNCIFGLCGIKDFYRRMFCVVVTSSEKQRMQWLSEVADAVRMNFP